MNVWDGSVSGHYKICVNLFFSPTQLVKLILVDLQMYAGTTYDRFYVYDVLPTYHTIIQLYSRVSSVKNATFWSSEHRLLLYWDVGYSSTNRKYLFKWSEGKSTV